MDSTKQQFIGIIQENEGIIRSLCRAYYPNKDDQQDAYQDIVLQLWRSFSSFRGDSSQSTWIYKVGLHTLLSKRRKEKKNVCIAYLETHTNNSFRYIPSFDDYTDLLHYLLQHLKVEEKAIFILHLEGYKNKEIADMLYLTPTNVSTKLNRIRTLLKSRFNTKPYEI